MEIKRLITLIAIAVVIFLGFTTWQSRQSVKAIRLEIKQIESQNTELFKINSDLSQKVKRDSILLVNSKLKIDSLLASDSINKQKLNVISWKYGKLKSDYNSATDTAKDSIFSVLINQ